MNSTKRPLGAWILGLLSLTLLAPRAPAQEEAHPAAPELAGRWTGAIDALGQVLEIRLSFARDGAGWRGTLAIPAQGMVDAKLAGIELEGSRVRFQLPGVPGNARFEGDFAADGQRIEGPYWQHGVKMRWHASSAAADSRDAAGLLGGFGEWLEAARAAWNVPGIAVACVRGDQVLLLEARGRRDVEGDLPVTPDTLFAIGSCTKAFTALTLGLFVADGRVGWDDPVRDTLPAFRLHERLDSDGVTLRDLVTHRTGLPRHDSVWYGRPSLSRRAVLERLPHLEPTARPRELWQYNNLMYVVAGLVIEELAGAHWEDAVAQRLVLPLGMARTVFSVAEAEADPDHALPYRSDGGAVARIPYRRIENVGPAGSIQSSARDMAQWVKLMLGSGAVDGTRIADAATIRTQMQPAMLMPGFTLEQDILPLGYGHGWAIHHYRGHLRVSHGGGIDGFAAMVALVPRSEVGVVVLANAAGGLPELVARHALDRLLELEARDWSAEALAQKRAVEAQQAGASDETPRRSGAAPPRPLEEYAGVYEHPGYGRVVVTSDEGALRLTGEEIGARLEPWHFEVFRFAAEAGSPLERQLVQFVSGFEGEIEGLRARSEAGLEAVTFARLPDPRLTDASFLARYVGRYSLSGVAVRVELRGARLTVTVPGQPTYKLAPVKLDLFALVELPGFRLRFEGPAPDPPDAAVFLQPNGVFRAERLQDPE